VIGGTRSYSVADHLGSVVRTTDSAGTPTHTRDYDPWGNPLQGSTTGGYAFTGRGWDPETQLYDYRARYYDPKIGRFVSEDPMGTTETGGSNHYAYVEGNPILKVDPLGLFSMKAKDPAKISQATWNAVYNSVRDACCKVDPMITDPKLRKGIKESCDSGTVLLRMDCRNPEQLGGPVYPLEAALFGPFRTTKLCVNNWKKLVKAGPGNVAIHEWAHGCGWFHGTGKGVPINSGYSGG